jgi:hypothetical protein
MFSYRHPCSSPLSGGLIISHIAVFLCIGHQPAFRPQYRSEKSSPAGVGIIAHSQTLAILIVKFILADFPLLVSS